MSVSRSLRARHERPSECLDGAKKFFVDSDCFSRDLANVDAEPQVFQVIAQQFSID